MQHSSPAQHHGSSIVLCEGFSVAWIWDNSQGWWTAEWIHVRRSSQWKLELRLGQRFTFQHDHDSEHTADNARVAQGQQHCPQIMVQSLWDASAQCWAKGLNIFVKGGCNIGYQESAGSPKCPDLNHIEQIWSKLSNKLDKSIAHYEESFWLELQKTWGKMSVLYWHYRLKDCWNSYKRWTEEIVKLKVN